MNRLEILTETMKKLQVSVEDIEQELNAIVLDLANETKSSAGDKYETAREMIQQERVKLEQAKALKSQHVGQLKQFLEIQSQQKIAVGSIIQTSDGRFLLGVPFGKVILDDHTTLFGLGATSPLSQLLLGKQAKEQIELNGMVYKIDSVY
jgi:LPS O-antigen subunit length determinant protein (WzzB/FepE family)